MSNLIDEFFNFNGPCPDRVPNCQQLREQYLRDILDLRNSNCKSCAEANIKASYMGKVWNAFMKSLS
jgi:hypothetical protein